MRPGTLAILITLTPFFLEPARAGEGPPVAPVRPVVDDYYGIKVTDPYRYFEDLNNPEVQKWIKGQALYARKTLEAIPGREELLARIRELDAGQPYRIWILRRWPSGDLHYLKMRSTENLDKLYIKEARTGEERLLIDPDAISKGQKHAALSFCRPSPDGKYIAYGLAEAGSEQTVLHVLDVRAAKDLPETIDRIDHDYTPPYWLPDSSGFVYCRRRLLPADAPPTEEYKKSAAFLHKLRTDPERDPELFSMEHSKHVPMSEADFPGIVLPIGSKFAIGKIQHGDANELTLYAAPVESLGEAKIPWKKICDVEDEVKEFAVAGDRIYLLSAAKAPRYKLVRTSLAEPDFAKGQALLAPWAGVLDSVDAARDGIYVEVVRDGIKKIMRLAFESGAKPELIQFPEGEPSGSIVAASPDTDGVLIRTASWTHAGRIYSYDPSKKSMADTGLAPRGKFDDPKGIEAWEAKVKSHDGVEVPLSIIHARRASNNGLSPTLVMGYGAYGMSSWMHYSPTWLAWLERGGIIAIAHVRGGGEYGKEWHLAGQKKTKPNTWKDFIACCQYLIDEGYTSPGKLAGQGGSAGGILIGRAITERPDLFAAALIQVGCLDALRMETTANGVPNIQEFGTVKTREGFEALYEMSAYHHVKDGVKYPAVLLTHGMNDPRVEPWQSAKMAARLQAATASGKPVLLRVDYEAGHGIGSTKKQRQEELADEWAFMLWQMGLKVSPQAHADQEQVHLGKIIRQALPETPPAPAMRPAEPADYCKPSSGLAARIDWQRWGTYGELDIMLRLKNVSERAFEIPRSNAKDQKDGPYEIWLQEGAGDWRKLEWTLKAHAVAPGPVLLKPGQTAVVHLDGTTKDKSETISRVKVRLKQEGPDPSWRGELETAAVAQHSSKPAAKEPPLSFPDFFPPFIRRNQPWANMSEMESQVKLLWYANWPIVEELERLYPEGARKEMERRMEAAGDEERMKLFAAAHAAALGSQKAGLVLLEAMKRTEYNTVKNVTTALGITLGRFKADPPDWIVEMIASALGDDRFVTGLEKTNFVSGTSFPISYVADEESNLTWALDGKKCRKAVPALIEMARRTNYRRGPINALGSIGDPRGAEVVIEALAANEAKIKIWSGMLCPEEFRVAASAAGSLKAKAAVPILLRHVCHRDVVEALEAIGDPAAIPAMKKIVADNKPMAVPGSGEESDRDAVWAARIALATLEEKDPLPRYCELLADRSLGQYARRAVVWKLGNLRDARAIPHLIKAIRTDPSGAVVNQSVAVLAAFKTRQALEGLIECFDADFKGKDDWKRAYTPEMFRQNVAEALRDITGEGFGPNKEQWVRWLREGEGKEFK